MTCIEIKLFAFEEASTLREHCSMLYNFFPVFRAAQENIIAVIGPRSSTNVHATNLVCSGLHLPQLAPVATDPTLGPYEYPFLARVSDHCRCIVHSPPKETQHLVQ